MLHALLWTLGPSIPFHLLRGLPRGHPNEGAWALGSLVATVAIWLLLSAPHLRGFGRMLLVGVITATAVVMALTFGHELEAPFDFLITHGLRVDGGRRYDWLEPISGGWIIGASLLALAPWPIRERPDRPHSLQ